MQDTQEITSATETVVVSETSPQKFFEKKNFIKKPEKIIRSKPRIVKDNQIWQKKGEKSFIKIIGQTKYFRCTAFFNVADIDEKGNYINDFIDEFTEEEILEKYRLQKSYAQR